MIIILGHAQYLNDMCFCVLRVNSLVRWGFVRVSSKWFQIPEQSVIVLFLYGTPSSIKKMLIFSFQQNSVIPMESLNSMTYYSDTVSS